MNRPLFIIFFILSLFGIEGVNAQCLIAFYPFDGNANDVTGSGNDGTVSGATLTFDRFGNANAAYSFDGTNDYVSFPAGNFLLNEFTYSLWIRPGSVPPSGDFYSVISIGWAGGDQHILISNDPGTGLVGIGGGGYDVNVNAHRTLVNALPTNLKWYHLAVSRSNSEYKFYIDGILVASGAHSGFAAGYGSSPIGSIGARRNSSQFYDGVIDDVQIFNCTLTDADIRNIAGPCVITVNDTVLFPFYDTTTITINDTVQIPFYDTTTITINDTLTITDTTTVVDTISVTDTLFIDIILSTNPLVENQIKVYPNPTNNLIIIENGNYSLMNNYTIRLANDLGQVLFTSPVNTPTITIDLNQFSSAGLYLLQVYNSNNQLIQEKKIILY